jgi:hypothetical protein
MCQHEKSKQYFISGKKKLEKKDFAGALKDFSLAIEIEPYFIEAFEQRSLAKAAMGNDVAAGEDAKKAKELKINLPNLK